MSDVDGLRQQIAEVLQTLHREHSGHPNSTSEADAVLPVVTGYAEQQARRRAAEELGTLVAWARANRLGNLTVDALHRECSARWRALADDGQP